MAFGIDIQKTGIRALRIAVFCLLPNACLALPQSDAALADSVLTDSAASDSLFFPSDAARTDSTASDSVFIAGVDSLVSSTPVPEDTLMKALLREVESVSYSGDTIEMIPAENVVNMSGKATLEYKDASLGADRIHYDMKKENLTASGDTFLKDNSGEIAGQEMRYDLEDDKGVIKEAKTQHEEWYFRGETISKVGQEDLYAKNAEFTTCDLDEPHYHFKCRQLKLRIADKVIARPIVFYVRDIPFFIFPFYVFPIQTGRKSGLLKPDFGLFSDDARGRSITNLGYFWAASDYYDITIATDLYERLRWSVWGEGRYKKRYSYDGRVFASYTRDTARGDRRRGEYVVRHNHTLTKKSALKVDVNIATDRNIYKDLSYNIDQVLQQSLKSRITYNRRENWGSYYLTFDSDYSLEKDKTTIQAPAFSLTKNSTSIFKPAPGVNLPQWYGNLTYGVSGDFTNKRLTETDSIKVNHQTGTINANLNNPMQVLGWLNVSPGFSYREVMFHSDEPGVGLLQQGTYTMTANVFTRLYGVFDGPRIGPVTKWRHTISPQVSYSYSPRRQSAGSDQSDYFSGISSFGRNIVNLTLSNDLDAKYMEVVGEKTEIKSLTLAKFVMNTSYDIKSAREGKPGWGNLRSRLESHPNDRFTFSLEAVHSLYDGTTFDPFLTGMTTNFTLTGKGRNRETEETVEADDSYMDQSPYADRNLPDYRTMYGAGLTGPWTFTLTHNLNKSRTGTAVVQSFRNTLSFNASKKWRLLYSYQYDLTNGDLQDQTLTLRRELHRWEMFISLRQLPRDRFSYEFRVNLKDIPALEVKRGAQTP